MCCPLPGPVTAAFHNQMGLEASQDVNYSGVYGKNVIPISFIILQTNLKAKFAITNIFNKKKILIKRNSLGFKAALPTI